MNRKFNRRGRVRSVENGEPERITPVLISSNVRASMEHTATL